ncbi:hypothetical protein [Desulforamulus putei]|uniref:Tetratricopeptide repeat-containing protein n=1 Tax=Desulforamulus putei DSM 12395 TaxID=1121429 RepID=A0A1M4VV46_9FIRM|nr:hypothetical protein [Desulforamulus putei]SHE72780.1 hypothetical protein SAMN02745133_01007 [Desulforamulus putei DSM 12395]
MWVYWLTLGSLSIVLYFPYKKFFTKPVALRASIATFIIGMIYPLLQVKLSVAQTFFSIGLLLLFLGVTIARNHPYWDAEEPEETSQTNRSPDTTGNEWVGSGMPDMQHPVVQEETVPEEIKGRETVCGTGELTVKSEEQAEPVAPGESHEEMKPCKQQAVVSPEEEPSEIVMVGGEDNLPTVVAEESAPSRDVLEPDVPEPLQTSDYISGDTRDPEDVSREDSLLIQTLQETEHTPDTSLKTDIAEDASQTSGLAEDLPAASTTGESSQSPKSLLVEGLRLAKCKQYAQAVRHLNKVVAYGADPELLYLAISELSSIYQHLGLYPMALEIINAFAEHPSLKEHPGMANLKQKARFIRCLMDLLSRDRYGHIPYEQVPEAVRREAFDNSLNIKHLIS